MYTVIIDIWRERENYYKRLTEWWTEFEEKINDKKCYKIKNYAI